MKLKSALAAAAAASIAVAPAAAQAANEQLPTRAGSDLAEAEQLGGGMWLVPGLAILAILAGILAATDGDDVDLPVSP